MASLISCVFRSLKSLKEHPLTTLITFSNTTQAGTTIQDYKVIASRTKIHLVSNSPPTPILQDHNLGMTLIFLRPVANATNKLYQIFNNRQDIQVSSICSAPLSTCVRHFKLCIAYPRLQDSSYIMQVSIPQKNINQKHLTSPPPHQKDGPSMPNATLPPHQKD